MIVLEYILLVGVIVCAIAAPLCKRLLASVIVYMALSLMMAVLWPEYRQVAAQMQDAGVSALLFAPLPHTFCLLYTSRCV